MGASPFHRGGGLPCRTRPRPTPQHPARRLRPGAPALLAARGVVAALARPAARRGPRVHRLLHPLLALLPEPGQPLHRPLPAGPRGARQRDHARARRAARPRPPPSARCSTAAGYRSSYIGKWHLSHSAHPDMEAYGFADWDGNDRHFMGWAGTGVHFDPIIASNAAHWLAENAGPGGRRRPAVVPDRGPGQPPRRDVVPGRPARLPGAASRRGGRDPQVLESAAWKDDDPLPVYTDPYPEVCDTAPGQLRRRPPHQARGPPPVALGPAARAVGLHRPDRHRARGSATSTTTSTSTSWPTGAWAPCSAPSRRPAPGTTPSSSSPPTTATCAARTACARRGPFVYDEIMRVPLYVKVPGHHHTGHGDRRPRLPRRPGRHHLRAGRGRDRPPSGAHRPGRRPDPGAGRPGGHRPRPHPVRPGLGPDHRAQPGPLRAPRASSTAPPSTPATTGSAGASRRPGCGASRPGRSSSTSTAPSTTTTTSGTTTTPTPTNWSTWPTTARAGGAARPLRAHARLRAGVVRRLPVAEHA